MRKYSILIFLLSVFMVGCVDNSDDFIETDVQTELESNEFDEEEIILLAKKHTQQMLDDKFEEVASCFDDIIANQLSGGILKVTFDAVSEDMGDYIGIYGIETEVIDGNKIVVVVLEEYQFKYMKTTLTYNKDKQISGITFDYQEFD